MLQQKDCSQRTGERNPSVNEDHHLNTRSLRYARCATLRSG